MQNYFLNNSLEDLGRIFFCAGNTIFQAGICRRICFNFSDSRPRQNKYFYKSSVNLGRFSFYENPLVELGIFGFLIIFSRNT